MNMPKGGRSARGNPGSGVYVDLESLTGDRQTLVIDLIANWPGSKAPPPSELVLHVQPGWAELWRIWAEDRFPALAVSVRGFQPFSESGRRNSADIAIAASALADLITGRTAHAAVFSDQGDFMPLYTAIRDEPELRTHGGKTPFLWAATGINGPLSPDARQFFPERHWHTVPAGRQDGRTAGRQDGSTSHEKSRGRWRQFCAGGRSRGRWRQFCAGGRSRGRWWQFCAEGRRGARTPWSNR